MVQIGMGSIIDRITEKYGLDSGESELFREYTANRFAGCNAAPPEEPDLAPWERIAELAGTAGAAEIINSKLCPKYPVEYVSPGTVKIEIYDSFAGRIPVISAENEHDFEQLVTNIVHKGVRPANISKTGASFVSGKTVRFIILSAKPYSNVPARELGLGEREWAEKSLLVRRSHECTHYFTKQTYGIANNILHDELMADLIGLYDAFGYYRAEWFLRFMGVIEGGGGRLIVYTSGLPERVRAAVTELVSEAAYSLEEWTRTERFAELSDAERIKLMCAAGTEGMAEGRLSSLQRGDR